MTAKTSHFQGQRASEQVNPHVADIRVLYFTILFGVQEFLCHFCQKISWTSMKTLVMELVGHDSQNGPFSRSNNLRIIEPVGIRDKNYPFSRSNEPYISPWIFVHTEFCHHLFQKFTWTSIKSLAMELLYNQLPLTTKMAHFQGQTSPSVRKPPILPNFVCYSSPFFLVFWNFEVFFAKIFAWTSVKTLVI
ncbi:hypothetical protein H5410_031971 [Solanum commersonii]|uniref:Uncharacterized protein n=1 Tax=Solanum commersonii TaxID=4109 RepID=A0A9J5YJU7_SOLCO|nr:hypothetical protein H5410_031971 [Solanum commersonii]